jgi:hypothetical protein
MTLGLTLAGTPPSEDEFRRKGKAGTNEMVYRINEHQLLRVWSVISSFSRIREIDDPLAQSEILTNAQMLLTAFVFDLGAVARGRGWRFAQLSIRRVLGLVYRLVALSPVLAAPEGSAAASSAGWGSSAGVSGGAPPSGPLPGFVDAP